MSEYLIQSETLDDIADAINAKTGGSSAMTPAQMVAEIESIQTGGGAVEHYQFIHAEDWLTDSVGNGRTFYNTYLAQLYGNKKSGFVVTTISNNNATQFAAVYVFRNLKLSSKTAWMRRNGLSFSTNDTGETNSSFYISAGSIIDVYITTEAEAI